MYDSENYFLNQQFSAKKLTIFVRSKNALMSTIRNDETRVVFHSLFLHYQPRLVLHFISFYVKIDQNYLSVIFNSTKTLTKYFFHPYARQKSLIISFLIVQNNKEILHSQNINCVLYLIIIFCNLKKKQKNLKIIFGSFGCLFIWNPTTRL